MIGSASSTASCTASRPLPTPVARCSLKTGRNSATSFCAPPSRGKYIAAPTSSTSSAPTATTTLHESMPGGLRTARRACMRP